ncbi:hypothetical protein, partial [Arthrobacter sp. JCM 19049]|uniref:hypothetical protein n=1 Tax=Arthrobacter sp. JCM 19049 TaxID=1460643 RepID=UPI0024370D1E
HQASRAEAESGARPRLVCTMMPVALSTGRSWWAGAGPAPRPPGLPPLRGPGPGPGLVLHLADDAAHQIRT